jgi:predicted PurR-regulated permease PerM
VYVSNSPTVLTDPTGEGWFDTVVSFLAPVVAPIVNAIAPVVAPTVNTVAPVVNTVTKLGSAGLAAATSLVNTATSTVTNAAKTLVSTVTSGTQQLAKQVVQLGQSAYNTLTNVGATLWQSANNAVANFRLPPDPITKAIDQGLKQVGGALYNALEVTASVVSRYRGCLMVGLWFGLSVGTGDLRPLAWGRWLQDSGLEREQRWQRLALLKPPLG